MNVVAKNIWITFECRVSFQHKTQTNKKVPKRKQKNLRTRHEKI